MKTCKYCKGTGRVTLPPTYPPKRTHDTFVDCPQCAGSGEGSVMVFWRCDTFPFVLAGQGTLQDDGTAFVPSYQGSFRPTHILPMKEGKELAAKLKALAAEQDIALTAVRAGFHARLKEIAPWVIKK